jgi:hypothetical protein
MTIKMSGRSALILAMGLLAGAVASPQAFAAPSDATVITDALAKFGNPANAASGNPNQMAATDQGATDQASDSDHTANEEAPAAAMSSGEAPASTESANPVAASSGDNAPSDTASLIGKIFIGAGTLLTLASAARMFMG